MLAVVRCETTSGRTSHVMLIMQRAIGHHNLNAHTLFVHMFMIHKFGSCLLCECETKIKNPRPSTVLGYL